MSNSDTLSSLLAECLAGKGAIPLSISVKEDEEVQRLREEVSDLQARNSTLQIELDRAQYLFRCESILTICAVSMGLNWILRSSSVLIVTDRLS